MGVVFTVLGSIVSCKRWLGVSRHTTRLDNLIANHVHGNLNIDQPFPATEHCHTSRAKPPTRPHSTSPTPTMAASHFTTETYTPDTLTESAGTVLFRLSTREVCVLHYPARDEYLLPKGRRRIGETRAEAAVRETREETGVPCRLLPVDLLSLAEGPAGEEVDGGGARVHKGVCEPILVQVRKMRGGQVKMIWWFVGAVEEGVPAGKCEEGFTAGFYGYEEAVRRLTFGDDRELVRRAIELVEAASRR